MTSVASSVGLISRVTIASALAAVIAACAAGTSDGDVTPTPDAGTVTSDAGTAHDARAADAAPAYDAWVEPDASTFPDASPPHDSGPTCNTTCNGVCVDFTSDPLNCGACGHSCMGAACSMGACASVVVSNQFTPPGRMVVDATNAYWTGGGGGVLTAPLAGGATTVLAPGGAGSSMGIAVDATNVYWVSQGDGSIYKMPLAGGTPVALAISQPQPYALVVNATNVFWTTIGSGAGNGTLMTCAIAGCSQTPTQLASGLQYAYGLAIDSTYVYWTTLNGGEVRRVLIGGGGELTMGNTFVYPYAVAVNATQMAILEYGQAGMIWVAPIGGGAPTQIAGGQSFPQNMTADSTAAYWDNWQPGPNHETVLKCPLAGCNHQPQVMAYGFQPCGGIVTDATWLYWLSNDGTVLKTPK